MKSFANKVAAITGAASGMGRELALALAKENCALALSDVNEAELARTVELAAASGVRVTARKLDVADRKAMFEWAAEVVRDHGRVNLLFNNAGVALSANVETMRIEDFEWLMGINFWGVVHGTQAFLPHLKASGEGHVVNTSSLFGILSMPTQSAYNASKFGVRGFTEALRLELEVEGATVSATCVHPGGIATNIVNAARVDPNTLRQMGVSLEQQKKSANKMLQTTSAASAARQILDAVRRDARRVLVGPDAKFFDSVVRLMGAKYQRLIVRFAKQRFAKDAAAAKAALPESARGV